MAEDKVKKVTEATLEAPAKKAAAKPKTATKPKADAKPKAEVKPKAEAKPKVEDKPKTAAKPKADAKPKVAAEPKADAKPKAEAKPKAAKKPAAPKKAENRLLVKYKEEVVPALMKQFNYTSVMEVPKLHKIVLNMGVGDAAQNPKLLEDAVRELTVIAGQKPVVTKAKKSEASFRLREGQLIGTKVDLRGERMYAFLDKLVSIALPRVRDFRGVSKNSYDGHGNYTLGVREQLIFQEIDFDQINKIRGMDIVIVTTANTDEEAHALLKNLGMPFQR